MTYSTKQIREMLDTTPPGPWRESKYVVYAGSCERICLTNGHPAAKLIAAAPTIIREQQDEIAALKKRVEELEAKGNCACGYKGNELETVHRCPKCGWQSGAL